MGFKYSVFTVMTPDLSLTDVATTLRDEGYDGVEWRIADLPDKIGAVDFWRGNRATVDSSRLTEEAPRIKALSDKNGLAIPALGTYLSADDLVKVERTMEASRMLACPQIRVGVPKYDGSRHYNELFETAVERYVEVEGLARKHRVKANIEIHHGTICPSASSAYRFVSNFDPNDVGVIFDPGNMIYEGRENWQMGLELLESYLSHVHVKNTKWKLKSGKDGTKRWQPVMCGLSEGFVDWREVLLALKKVGYEGWLSFEDFSKGATVTKLKQNLKYMKDLEGSLK